MWTPQRVLGPKSFHISRKMKLIEWPHMHEVGILPRYFVGISIFVRELVTASPLAQAADCILVRTFQDVFCRKAGADHHQHHLLAHVEVVFPTREPRNAAITLPILAHRT